jgi:PPM family protein phosphatase
MLNVRIASHSGIGAREHNEDELRAGQDARRVFAVLSDGAGGHRNGAVASDLVVRAVTTEMLRANELLPQALHDAVHSAQALLLAHQQGTDMHATLVALWIDVQRSMALWTHVGDSRLYLLRQGRVSHVTRDDSVVQQLVDVGFIDAAAARTHAMKHHLVCAMGVAARFVAHTIAQPHALVGGDAILLCSDGWWERVSAVEIERTLSEAHEPAQWLQAMQALIDHAADPQQDNHSAIALWFEDR